MAQTYATSISRQPTAEKIYKVLLADDHNIFRYGLKALLRTYPFIKCIGEALNGQELKKLVKLNPPDLIFMDLNMPGGNGPEATEEILKEYPDIKIIILSFYDDALTIEKMFKLGAIAYLTKSITLSILDSMFEKVLNNNCYICPQATTSMSVQKIPAQASDIMPAQVQWLNKGITVREKEVLQMMALGMSQKIIAEKMNLGSRTIETHKNKLMKKLGAKNKAQLISMAHEYKLL